MQLLLQQLCLLLPLLCAMPAMAGEMLSGRFTQERYLQGFDNALRSDGSFLLAPGRGLIWRVERPFAIVTAIGPAGLIQQVNGRETMHLQAERIPLLGQIYALLGATLHGDWQQLAGLGLDIKRTEENDRWHVELTPQADSGFEATGIGRITARGGLFVESLEMEKRGGDRDRLIFSGHALTAQPLSAADEALLRQSAAR